MKTEELEQIYKLLAKHDHYLYDCLCEFINTLTKHNKELNEENEQLKKKSKLINRGYVPHEIDWGNLR